MKSNQLKTGSGSFLTILIFSMASFSVSIGELNAQRTPLGGIARDFTIGTHNSDEQINLSDFDGKILVLDFFAHWCGPCRTSSPDLERNVNQYYHRREGNIHGIPVVVLPVNIEQSGESLTASFIHSAGLDWVAEDFESNQAYGQFETGSIPLFVIINGVASSASHEQWEVLYRGSGYPGAPELRAIIDSVEPPTEGPPSLEGIQGKLLYRKGESISLSVKRAQGTQPLIFEWYRDNHRIPNAYHANLNIPNADMAHSGDYHVIVRNTLGQIRSDTISITVLDTLADDIFKYDGSPIEIPDADQKGISSTIQIDYGRPAFGIYFEAILEHEYPDDLYLILTSPNGRDYHFDLHGGHFASDGKTFSYDLTGYLAIIPDGKWTLKVFDTDFLDEGRLLNWGLNITGPSEPNILYTQQVSSEAGPLTIPDNDQQGLKSQLSISLKDPVLKSEIYLILSHSYFPDLVVELITPNGSVLPLLNRVHYNSEELAMTKILTDWEGISMKGDWVLHIVDNDHLDQGELVSWGIRMVHDVDLEPGLRPPYFISGIPDTIEQALSHQLVAEDRDGDQLTFRKVSGPTWMTVSSDGKLDGSLPEGFFGLVQLVVEVSDGGIPPLTNTQTWQFEILPPVNESPVLVSENYYELTEGVLWEQHLTAMDPENHRVTFSSENLPSWLFLTADGHLEGIPPKGTQGLQIQFHVLLTDNGQIPAKTLSPIVIKIGAAINLPPRFISNSVFEIKEGMPWELLFEALDPDGINPPVFISTNLPTWLELTPEGRISGTPPLQSSGQVMFDLIIHDDGLPPSESRVNITLTVSASQLNQPPVFLSDSILTVHQHVQFEFLIQAEDPNGDTMSFAIESSEEWVSITQSGLLRGFPPLSASGQYPVSIQVQDNNENPLSTTQVLVLNVVPKPENQPPQIHSNPITTVIPGTDYTYVIEAFDSDGDILNYHLPVAPSWLKIDQNGILHGEVPAGFESSVQVIIGVSDGASPPNVALQEFNIMSDAPPSKPKLTIVNEDLVIQKTVPGQYYWLVRWESMRDLMSADWNGNLARVVAGPVLAIDSKLTFFGAFQSDNFSELQTAFFTVLVTPSNNLDGD